MTDNKANKSQKKKKKKLENFTRGYKGERNHLIIKKKKNPEMQNTNLQTDIWKSQMTREKKRWAKRGGGKRRQTK